MVWIRARAMVTRRHAGASGDFVTVAVTRYRDLVRVESEELARRPVCLVLDFFRSQRARGIHHVTGVGVREFWGWK